MSRVVDVPSSGRVVDVPSSSRVVDVLSSGSGCVVNVSAIKFVPEKKIENVGAEIYKYSRCFVLALHGLSSFPYNM